MRIWPTRVYRCDVCGNEGPWSAGWQWLGSIKDLEDGKEKHVCSDRCKQLFTTQDPDTARRPKLNLDKEPER